MKCMGTKQKPAGEWRCFSCLFAGNEGVASGSGSTCNAQRARVAGGASGGGGGERLLDMNAPPPPEEEEVQFVKALSSGGASLGIHHHTDQYDGRIQAACGPSIVRHSFNTSASYLQSLHMESGIYFQKPSQCASKDAMSIYEVPLHHRLNHDRMPGNADTRFKPDAILQTSHRERPKLPPASCTASEFYLQALKDFF